MLKKLIFFLVVGLILFLSPFFVAVRLAYPHTIDTFKETQHHDAAILFGAHITDEDTVTPLLQERLDAGILLYNQSKVDILVVSNTPHAADVMYDYLVDNSIPTEAIEIDTTAVTTKDSCIYEYTRNPDRSRIFISQNFHLPRLYLLCIRQNAQGSLFAAEHAGTIDRSNYSIATKIIVRTHRFFREATMAWGAFLN